MLVGHLIICVILVVIKVPSAVCKVHNEPSFKNVIIQAHNNSDQVIKIKIPRARSLAENSKIRSLQSIDNIVGPLTRLSKNSVANLPRLEYFAIKYSHLREIKPGAFKNLRKLDILTVQSCRLKRIEKEVFKNLNISVLFLKGNNISTVAPEAFVNLTKLETLDLSHNNISQWNKRWLSNTPQIKRLNFVHNKLEELPNGAFQNVISTRSITILLLSNKIVNVGERLFRNGTKIETLGLQNNKIRTFSEGVLEGVAQINVLDLSENQIQCFDGDWNKIFLAENTYLSFNPLTCSCQKNITKWTGEKAVINPDKFPFVFMVGLTQNCTNNQ
jgi:Leucine-rich repeat (LRR) protein